MILTTQDSPATPVGKPEVETAGPSHFRKGNGPGVRLRFVK